MSGESLDFFDRIPEYTPETKLTDLDRPWTGERWLLTHPATPTSLPLSDDDKTIWDKIDGERTVRDLLAALFEKGGSPVDIELLLSRLEREGFIHWKDRMPAAVDEAARFDREVRHLLHSLIFTEIRLSASAGFLNRIGPSWGVLAISTVMMLLYCLLGLIACDHLYYLFSDGHYTPLRVGGSVLVGLVGLAVWAVVLPNVAQLLFGLGVPRLGLRIREVAIRFRFGIPTLRVRTEDPVSLPPGAFARLLIARTTTYLGMAGIAVLALPFLTEEPSVSADLLAQLAIVALVLSFLSLSPLLSTQAYRSLCSYLRVKTLRRLAFRRLGHALAALFGGAKKEETVHERILLAFAAYTCAWTILAMKLASIVFRSELPLLLSDALSEESRAAVAITLLVLLCAAGGILTFALGSIFFVVWKTARWLWVQAYPKKEEHKILTNIPVAMVLAWLVWMVPGQAGWSAARIVLPVLFVLSAFFMASAAFRLAGSIWSSAFWVTALAPAGLALSVLPLGSAMSGVQEVVGTGALVLLGAALLWVQLRLGKPWGIRLLPVWLSWILSGAGLVLALVAGASSTLWSLPGLMGGALVLNTAFGLRHLFTRLPPVPPVAARSRAHSDRERLRAGYLDLRALMRGALVAHFGEDLCARYEQRVGERFDSEEKLEEAKEITDLAVRLDGECRALFDRVRALIGRRLFPPLVSAALHRIFWMEREVLVQHISELASTVGREGEEAVDAQTLLVRLPLFSGLDEDHQSAVASLFRRWHLPEGATVISQGEPGREFYVIAHGTVSVEVEDEWGQRRTVAHLADGDYFGEVALLQDVPRTATIVAQTPLDLFVLDRQDFRTHLTDVSTLSERIEVSVERVNLLRGISLFRRLPPALVSKVAAWFEPCRVKAGDEVIHEGERGEAFYIIVKGSCQVVCQRADSAEEELARLGPEEYFGEIALILQKPTTATVRATEPTDLLRLREDQFLAIFRENTFFAESVSRVAARRMIDTASRVSS